MSPNEALASFGLVLAVGFLIGLQREQRVAAEGANRNEFVGGIRTFPLVALVGGISSVLARGFGAWILVVSLAAFCLLIAIPYFEDVRQGRGRGLTSEAAFIVTFLLGALGLAPDFFPGHRLHIVGALGVATMALLAMKEALHEWAAKVSKDDLYATVKFLVVAVIVLPLLPAEPVWEISPRKIGLTITLIAGIGFAGYVAYRVLGAGRGLALTGLLGGLVSSTAVTLSLSGRAKEHPEIAPACAAGISLAWTVMFLRVLAIIGIVHPGLAKALAIPLVGAALAGAAGSIVLVRHMRQEASAGEGLKLSNPFSLWSAVQFGLLFTAVLVLSKLAIKGFGNAGLVAMAAIAGTTDVDAISLSVAKLAGENLSLGVAVLAILVACASNTFVKGGMAWFLGGAALGRRLVPVIAGMTILGGLGALLSWKLAG